MEGIFKDYQICSDPRILTELLNIGSDEGQKKKIKPTGLFFKDSLHSRIYLFHLLLFALNVCLY